MKNGEFYTIKRRKFYTSTLNLIKRLFPIGQSGNSIPFTKTPFSVKDSLYNVLSYDDTARRYSVHRQQGDMVSRREYTKYEDRHTEQKFITHDMPVDLHILHLKNAYIVKDVGVFTEDGHFIHRFFVGRSDADIFEGDASKIRVSEKRWRRLARAAVPIVEEDCFYGDIRDHGYGHFLLECIPRLWALPHIRPDLKIATSVNLPVYKRCLDGLGETRHQAFNYGNIVFCKSLYVATQPIFLYAYVERQAQKVWGKIGQAYQSYLSAEERKKAEKIYVSRRGIERRTLIDQNEIEGIFQKRGFHICYPEDLDFVTQISLFANARIVAAPYGSGIFNALFAQQPSSMFVMTSDDSLCWHFAPFDDKWALHAFVGYLDENDTNNDMITKRWGIKDKVYMTEILDTLYKTSS